MNKFLTSTLSLALSLVILATNFATPLFADLDIQVSDNGTDSSNDLNLTQTQTTTVDQSNTSDVNNQVTVDSNTGDNTASANTGDTEITTGDTSTDVSISNTLNTNTANVDNCCPTDTTASISGNGSGSDNTLNLDQTAETTISSANTANITNTITINANTGNNTANSNLGHVAINTGNISVSTGIANAANFNFLDLSTGLPGDIFASISGNGSNSNNNLNIALNRSLEINNLNFLNIFNWLNLDLNTGNNSANKNTGDVFIGTGDILATINISNTGNINDTTVDCCPEVSPSPQPTPTPEDDDDEDDNDDDDDQDDDNGGGGSDPDKGGPGGQILGLGPTGGDPTQLFFILYLLGAVSIAYGAYRMIKSKPRYLPQTPIIPLISCSIICHSTKPHRFELALSISLTRPMHRKLLLAKA